MPFTKTLKFFPLLMLLGIYSCKKKAAKQVLFLDDCNNGITCEILNGNIKQTITKGLGLNSDYCQNITFNETGDLTYYEEQYLEITSTEISTDSILVNRKIKYKTVHDDKGNLTAIVGDYQNDKHYREKWGLDQNRRLINSQLKSYKYDTNGDLVEFRRRYDILLEPDLFKYKYDSSHNLVESTLYDPGTSSPDQLLIRSEIEYPVHDANNNWTIRITHKRLFGPLSSLNRQDDTVSRKITYY